MTWDNVGSFSAAAFPWALSIVIGLLSAVYFNHKTQSGIASARSERLKRAREELVGVVESQLIGSADIRIDAIQGLIAAMERELEVVLQGTVTPEGLLEDADLRIQRSRHLTASQKAVLEERALSAITPNAHSVATHAQSAAPIPINIGKGSTVHIQTGERDLDASRRLRVQLLAFVPLSAMTLAIVPAYWIMVDGSRTGSLSTNSSTAILFLLLAMTTLRR